MSSMVSLRLSAFMVLRLARTTSVLPAAATSRLIGPAPPSEPSIMPLLLSTTHDPSAPSRFMILESESLMFATVLLLADWLLSRSTTTTQPPVFPERERRDPLQRMG